MNILDNKERVMRLYGIKMASGVNIQPMSITEIERAEKKADIICKADEDLIKLHKNAKGLAMVNRKVTTIETAEYIRTLLQILLFISLVIFQINDFIIISCYALLVANSFFPASAIKLSILLIATQISLTAVYFYPVLLMPLLLGLFVGITIALATRIIIKIRAQQELKKLIRAYNI